MQFRTDINGLRALAVIAVVIYHFNSSWMPGGFAGVDVFFVISGYLMTSIIFKGLNENSFSILKFYVARANRIIPALALLCITLLIFGYLFLAPYEYKSLGKHVGASMGFVSNIVYWLESGYFDTTSNQKWLLHTWSLSVEWQFYIIYPVILVAMAKTLALQTVKRLIVICTGLGFLYCMIATIQTPDSAYYMLSTRAWEMMMGALASIYPLRLAENKKKMLESFGLILILSSYLFITTETPWPGYLALLPVVGTYLIITANNQNSFVTGNIIFQKIGVWSYSIYLWHWPIVVAIYYFSLSEIYIYIGMLLSIGFGYLSYKHVEKLKLPNTIPNWLSLLKFKPVYLVLLLGTLGAITFVQKGYIKHSPFEYQRLIAEAKPNPFRNECHISNYIKPEDSCEYFGSNIEWAIFGDSHSTEIAYAIADKVKSADVGIKHFSFATCKPSYLAEPSTSRCAKWYNEVAAYILENKNIKNVVINHRFTNSLFGGDASNYPHVETHEVTPLVIELTERIDSLIFDLAAQKENVYVFYPIPELKRDIQNLLGLALITRVALNNVRGTTLEWYNQRNRYIISHFNSTNYPDNVHLIKSQDVFCDDYWCYAVRDGVPLYFDDDHPSISGAMALVKLID